MTDNQDKVIVEMKQQELDERLASAFESVRGRGYFYSDCGGRHHSNWKNTYDKILSAFECNEQKIIEEAVALRVLQPRVHRIMDQGCGHAQSLLELTLKLAQKYPENEFLGYGITGCLNDVWLGGRVFDFRITKEQQKLVQEHGIHSFQERGKNYQFFGTENDIHKVMKQFPYELDVIFSDNTYFHLAAPWLALKQTMDKLSVGGIALIRTLFNSYIYNFSHQKMKEEEIVENLQEHNPHYEILSSTARMDHRVLAIIKRADTPFKTHHYLAWVDEKSFDDQIYRNTITFYSKLSPPADFLAIDTL